MVNLRSEIELTKDIIPRPDGLDMGVFRNLEKNDPYHDSTVHGANMGPTWVLLVLDGPHVGSMNIALQVDIRSAMYFPLLLGSQLHVGRHQAHLMVIRQADYRRDKSAETLALSLFSIDMEPVLCLGFHPTSKII